MIVRGFIENETELEVSANPCPISDNMVKIPSFKPQTPEERSAESMIEPENEPSNSKPMKKLKSSRERKPKIKPALPGRPTVPVTGYVQTLGLHQRMTLNGGKKFLRNLRFFKAQTNQEEELDDDDEFGPDDEVVEEKKFGNLTKFKSMKDNHQIDTDGHHDTAPIETGIRTTTMAEERKRDFNFNPGANGSDAGSHSQFSDAMFMRNNRGFVGRPPDESIDDNNSFVQGLKKASPSKMDKSSAPVLQSQRAMFNKTSNADADEGSGHLFAEVSILRANAHAMKKSDKKRKRSKKQSQQV